MCPLKVASKTIVLALVLLLFSGLNAQSIKGFGDSITEGFGTTSDSKTFLSLLASKYSFTKFNYGNGGATMFDDCNDPSLECNISFTQKRFLSTSEASRGYVTIFFGTNDPQRIIDSMGNKWGDSLQKYIQESFIDEGYDKKKIIIITLPYNSTWSTAHNTYNRFNYVNQMIRTVATNLDIKVADLWTRTLNEPNGDRLTPDQVHLNDEGHQILADLISAQIGTLPVAFTSFTISCNKISWSTGNELNVKNFEVQRSIDGRNWEPIEKVNASVTNKYVLTLETNSDAYYRVVEIDIDGKKTYSNIERSHCENGVVYHFDHRTDHIFIEKASDVQIYNMAGTLVKHKKNARELAISDLPRGVYMLKINQQYFKISKF